MKIKYSILSRGTEKYVGHGYMAISEPKNGKQYIFDLDHNILDTNEIKNKLSFPSNFSINNIVFSRFELISELLFRRVLIQDNILICGLGSVGIACLINLLEHGYKKIFIYSKNPFHNLELIEKMYDVKLMQVDKIDDSYKSYIELTGDSLVLKKIIESTQNWFGHLISDVAGSKTSKGRGLGLPVPGWAALQKLQFGSFEINGKSLNIAEVSEWMFQNGYDVRAFTAQLIPVIINETLIRTYWILKQHFYYGQSINESMPSASRREVDRLLLVSSAVFSTLDIGDAFIKSQTSSKPGGATGTFLMTMNIPELAAFGLHAVQNVRNEVKHRRYIENLIDTDIEEEWLRIMEN